MTASGNDQPQAPMQRTSAAALGRATSRHSTRDPRNLANEVGKGLLLGVVLLAVGIALFFHLKSALFVNLASLDAVDAAQIAYNFRAQKHLSTSVIYPVALAGSRPDTKGLDIGRPPLYPVLLGIFMKARGVSDDSVVMFNALCLFALAWVLYGIIKMAYDRATAIWCILGYFASVPVVALALAANGSMLTALLFSVAILCALYVQRRTASSASPPVEEQVAARPTGLPWIWLVGVGVAGGLAYLSGYYSPLMLVSMAAIATSALAKDRRRAFYAVLGVSLVFGLSWAVRNLLALGTPWSPLNATQLVMGTKAYPGNSILWTLSDAPANPLLYLLGHPGEWLRKVALAGIEVYRLLPDTVERYLFPFLVGGLIWTVKTPERKLLWTVFVCALLLQALSSVFATASDTDFGILRPLGTCLGIATVVQVFRGLRLVRWARLLAVLGAIAILAVPYLGQVLRGKPIRTTPSVNAMAQLPRMLDMRDRSLIVTDNPWVVAWYGHFRSVLLPKTPQDMEATIKLAGQPDFYYFTATWVGRGRGPDDPWPKLLTDREQAPKLGMPLPLPYDELLVLTRHGAEKAPKTRERYEAAYQRLREQRRNRASSAPAAPSARPGGAQ